MERGAWQATVHRVAKSWMWCSNLAYIQHLREHLCMRQGDPPSPTLAGPCRFGWERASVKAAVSPSSAWQLPRYPWCSYGAHLLFTVGSWDFKSLAQSTLHECLQCWSTLYELTDFLSWDSHLSFQGRPARTSVSKWPTEESVSRSHCCASLGCAGEHWPLGLLSLGRQEVVPEPKQSWKSLRTKCVRQRPVSLWSIGEYKGVWAHTCPCVCVWCHQNILTQAWSLYS